jgi:hypothetical protein
MPSLAEHVRDDLADRGDGVRGLGMSNDANLVSPVDLHVELFLWPRSAVIWSQ